MADQEPGWPVERWVSFATTIIAPATVLSALLFYFGYVSARTQYAYFGVDVDTIGLSTRDYVMRSPQPLLFPLLMLTLLAAGGVRLHVVLVRRIAAATSASVSGAGESADLTAYDQLARWTVIIGWMVVGLGLLLILGYSLVRDWAAYNLVVPLMLSLAALLIAYASRLTRRLHPAATPDATTVAQRRLSSALVVVLIVGNLFWATATLAQWTGLGVAHHDAAHLDELPSVILDTSERLYLRAPGVEETVLPSEEGQTFHYRYRHLRLLIQGKDRMFLVPDTWSASNTTLAIPLDDSVRVQFQFRNDPP